MSEGPKFGLTDINVHVPVEGKNMGVLNYGRGPWWPVVCKLSVIKWNKFTSLPVNPRGRRARTITLGADKTVIVL